MTPSTTTCSRDRGVDRARACSWRGRWAHLELDRRGGAAADPAGERRQGDRGQGREPAAPDDADREARAAAAARRTGRSPTRREAPSRRRRRLQPDRSRRRSTTSSTSRSSSRGCTSRSCSRTTRSTATGRSSRSRSAPPAASIPSVATADDTIGARESATVGIKQIYSPMVDVSHEPRWGRISEGAGEDPYLGSVFAAARVKAAQGTDYSAPDKVVASVKHFAAYGQPEGGREYNTTDMSEQRLRNLYLPPFKAAIDAGAGTAMCSFNAINGVPGCANHETETQILKKRVGLRRLHRERLHRGRRAARVPAGEPGHRPVRPRRRRRRPRRGRGRAERRHRLRDGLDELPRLRRPARRSSASCSMSRIDDAVRRILRIKFRAGLFDHPYVDQAKAVDPASFVTPADRAAARTAAGRSRWCCSRTTTRRCRSTRPRRSR